MFVPFFSAKAFGVTLALHGCGVLLYLQTLLLVSKLRSVVLF